MSLLPLILWLAFYPSERFDAPARVALEHWRVPGIALVVVTPDQIIHLKGSGLRQHGKPERITPDTVFPLASCTKAFTTALVAMLVEEGKLKWDAPVRKHLPEFRLGDLAANAQVTLRDLAAHRTGVAAHDLLWYRSPWSQEELVRRVGKLPLSAGFRTEMQYQSVMYIALGQAAAAAGGKPWADLVRERIVGKLGMKQVTFTTIDAAKLADRATGHRREADGQLTVLPPYEQKEPNAAGSMNASARDLAAWLQWHLRGGMVGEELLLKEELLRETRSPQTIIRLEGALQALNPDTQQISYGLGWVVQDYRGHSVVQHAGLIDGTRVHLTILPKDGFAFAILANLDATRLNLALSNTLVDELLGLPKRDWNSLFQTADDDEETSRRTRWRREDLAKRPGDLPTATDEQLAGDYEEPAYGTSRIRATAIGLVWEWGSWKLDMEHYAGDTFRVKFDNPRLDRLYLRFRVEEGKVLGYRVMGMDFIKSVGK